MKHMNLFSMQDVKSSEQYGLSADGVKEKILFMSLLDVAFDRLDRDEILEDRRVAFRTCNRWLLAWHLLEPNVSCLGDFLQNVFKYSNYLYNCLLYTAKDTTIRWDPNDEQFWNKPCPSESAVKIGNHIRCNCANVRKE